jgi:hypothetical protein
LLLGHGVEGAPVIALIVADAVALGSGGSQSWSRSRRTGNDRIHTTDLRLRGGGDGDGGLVTILTDLAMTRSVEHELLIDMNRVDPLVMRRERRDRRVGEDEVVHHRHLILEDDRTEVGVDGECGSHSGEWQMTDEDEGRRRVSCRN